MEEEGRAKWRGHVTHVTSGERRYLESLSGIADFIMPYLERWGVRFGAFRRFDVLDIVRKETFGVDIGQNSWLTVDEYDWSQ